MKSCHALETSLSSQSESVGTLERMAMTAAVGTHVSQRTCGGRAGGRYLGGKDRRATEGKDGRWQRQAAAAQGDGWRRFWSLLGYFRRIAKIAGGKSANVHSQVGGLKREIYPHHWMVILRSKLPACRLALNGCLHPGRCHG
jgi:hypothetical protein